MKKNDSTNTVNIKEIIVWIVQKWKLALIIAAFSSIVIFIFMHLGYVKKSRTTIEEIDAEIEEKNTLYTSGKEYQKQIKLLQEKILSNAAYNNNSILMQIDAMNENVKILQYELNDMSVCKDLMGIKYDICKQAVQNVSYIDKALYMEEIVDFSFDTDDNGITNLQIKIIGRNKCDCVKAAEAIKNEIDHWLQGQQRKNEMLKYALKDTKTYVSTDAELQEFQMKRLEYANVDYINTIKRTIATLETEEMEFFSPKEKLIQEASREPKENLLKFLIEALLGGAVISFVLIAVWYLMSGKIKTVGELTTLYQLNILGVLHRKKNAESANRYAYECIRYELTKDVSAEQQTRVLILGTLEEQENCISQVQGLMEKNKNISVKYWKKTNICMDLLKKIDSADKIVLLVQTEKDTYEGVEEIMAILRQRNAYLLGAIVRKGF